MGVSQAVGGLGAALKSYNSSSDKNIAPENQAMTRRMSFRNGRELSQAKPPYSLSRSLGPFQGTPPSTQFRPPILPSRGNGSDPLDNLGAPRGIGQSLTGESMKMRPVSSNVGFLVASSPPRSNNIGQKVSFAICFVTGYRNSEELSLE